MSIHLLNGKKEIENAYLDYLRTSFYINDKILMKHFEKSLVGKDRFAQGPYLEVTAPYKKSKSIKQLIEERELSNKFLDINQEALPANRELYSHQVKAVKLANNKKNFIVATGTGSGKTESFMLPILNHLLKEQEEGTLTPGVRALFLYPMNALANDQMKRLRKILENTPEITFGRYTGETKTKRGEAEEVFKQVNKDEKLLPNELLSREEMRDNPPHILVTNYAMLEYLLLRPDDTPFFDGGYSDKWQYIVLDEAHTYNGAKGIEIGMLIRRLKDRVLKSRPYNGTIQCIATSATLGSGKDAKRKVIDFAENVFDEKFDYINENNCAIIEAERINYNDYYEQLYEPDWEVYPILYKLLEKNRVSIEDVNKLRNYEIDINNLEGMETEPSGFVYDLLKNDTNLFTLRKLLANKPKKITDVISHIEKDILLKGNKINPERLKENIIKLVELAVKAKGKETDEALLPARYHVFVRSIEGAFVKFFPEFNFSLESKKNDEFSGYPYFELGVCDSCGQPHIIGEEREGHLVQQQSNSTNENIQFYAYMIVNNPNQQNAYDQDEELLEGEHVSNEVLYELCPCCSNINIKGKTPFQCCEKAGQVKKILLYKEEIKFDSHAKCRNCGKRSSNPIRRFVIGQDGATSVLSTALYQQLVKDSKREQIQESSNSSSLLGDSAFSFLMEHAEQNKKDENYFYDPQKLLVFSDSRQAAAYFSPYLERTYNHIIWRNIIYSSLREHQGKNMSVDSLSQIMMRKAEEQNIYDNSIDLIGRRKIAHEYILRELIKGEERNSLEGVGLIDIKVELPKNMIDFKDRIGEQFSLSGDEAITLFNVLFDSFRYYNALEHSNESDPRDELFFPKNRQVSINKNQSVTKSSIMSWLPTSNQMNKRVNYLMKIYQKKGKSKEESKELAHGVLELIWNEFVEKDTILNGYFTYYQGNRIMSDKFWRVGITDIVHRCDTCGNVTTRNIMNVCPKNNCSGTLKLFNPDSEFNHYRKLYENIISVPMTVREHTAQLSPETAMNYQEQFVKGDINVLSCSTTFEMGVDVGDLESVFMRNVPPDTANYIQRAGRAGRRKSSVAFVLTYANRRSHDLTFYEKPEEMIAGIIKPPIFKMDNKKVIQRHLHSVALSQFFKEYSSYFGELNKFFRDEQQEDSGQFLLTEFLKRKPVHLLQSIRRIIPESIINEIEVKNWGWTKELLVSENKDSLLKKITTMYFDNINQLESLKEKNYKSNTGSVDIYQKLIKTQTSESLISYFSRHNILPKYGFPVDVVEMQVMDREADRIRLNRDLTMAISEYSPGSEIIANGYIFQSTGLRLVRGFELTRKYYTECKQCNHYQMLNENDPNYEETQMSCESCGEMVPINKIVVPSFGFVAKKKGKAGERKPNKEYRSRVFFSDYDFNDEADSKELTRSVSYKDFVLETKYSPYGKLAVVNSAKGKGYHLCNICGAVIKGGTKKTKTHKAPNGSTCSGKFSSKPVHLGHEFMSDVLEIQFQNLPLKIEEDVWHWESVLYALLNGASVALGVDRNDIDGVVHYKNQENPSIILYDKVPGGAGYMKEIYEQLDTTLKQSLEVLKICSCGLETSCYGCLKNYLNQYAHDHLARGVAINMLEMICSNIDVVEFAK